MIAFDWYQSLIQILLFWNGGIVCHTMNDINHRLISNILFSIIIHNKIVFLKWCLKIDEIWYFFKNLK